jgi:pimeloyl-ACP methyl ester carboxylesterase
MQTVVSKDGTRIAYEQSGTGEPLILMVGAFNDHTTGHPLTEILKQHFTVFNYDRRGRGESGDTLPYAVEREIEDLGALIEAAGGSAYVFGYSSGAVLAVKAARTLAIKKLALYEPPPTGEQARHEAAELDQLVKADRRGDAVALFQKGVGIPEAVTAQMRNAPFWAGLEAVAHTLVYEMTILADLPQVVDVPTLVMDGGNSPAILHDSAQAIVDLLPKAERRTLPGQTHDIVADVVAPEVMEFLKGG